VAIEILPRSLWDALPPKTPPTKSIMLDGITFHWNGPPLGLYTADWVPGYLQRTQRTHMFTDQLGPSGGNDIAYNLGLDRFGRVWEARGWDVRNAASGGSPQNSTSVAVELILGKGDPFTGVVRNSMVQLCRSYLDRGPQRRANWYGHRDWVATECPGTEIYAFVRDELPGLVQAPPPANNPFNPKGQTNMRCFQDPNGTLYLIREDGKVDVQKQANTLALAPTAIFPALRELFRAGFLVDDPDAAPRFTFEAMAFIKNGAYDS
jgi:hypothetical protein